MLDLPVCLKAQTTEDVDDVNNERHRHSMPPCTPCHAPSGMLGDNSYLQAVIGSAPSVDGNFDRNNSSSAVITDGKSDVSLAMVNEYAGQAAYIIPASKCEPSFHDAFAIAIVNIIAACPILQQCQYSRLFPVRIAAIQYAPLTLSDRSDRMRAHFCCRVQPNTTHWPLSSLATHPAWQPALHPRLPYLAKLSVSDDSVDGKSIFTSVWLFHGRHGLVFLFSP